MIPNKGLSSKDQRELDALPKRIEVLEAEKEVLQILISDPSFYKNETTFINDNLAKLAQIENMLQGHYQRWEELDKLK